LEANRFITQPSRDIGMKRNQSKATRLTRREALHISGAPRPLPAVVVDCADTYSEIDLGLLSALNQTVALPHASDWALALGGFAGPSRGGDD
jgi:hypothetical protein